MKYVELGGRKTSAIGLGLWQFGSQEWGWGGSFNEAEATRIVQHALDRGINFFDTAELYGHGRSEEILSRALGSRRAEAIIATKISPHHLTRAGVLAAASGSLARLGVEAIDLYQIHWPNRFVPIRWTMGAMRDLIRAGKIRAVGVSNFSLSRWRRAETALGEPVISNQVQYHLLDHDPETELMPYCQQEGRIILAYSPLAQGVLSGRYGPLNPPRDFRASNRDFMPVYLESVQPLIEALREIGARHEATPAQVALAWLIHQPRVIAIPGARSVEQVEQNAASADIELSAEEVTRLGEMGRQLGRGGRRFGLKRLAAWLLGA